MNKIYIALFTLLAFSSGCKDDNPVSPAPTPVDVRDASVGTYSNGQVTVYDLQFEKIVTLAAPFKVSKGSDNSIIYIDLDGEIIKGEKIIDSGDGFVFDIVDGSFDAESGYEGYAAYKYSGSSYSGIFKKQLDGFNNVFNAYMGISDVDGVYSYWQIVGSKD